MALYLGYSGIHGSLQSQQDRYHDSDPRLSRFAQGLDAAAALVSDSEVIAAAAEERFTGVKGTGDFPVDAMRYCLDRAGVGINDLDGIVHAFDYHLAPHTEQADPDRAARYHDLYSTAAQRRLLEHHFPNAGRTLPLTGVRHHLAHAHSAFDLSGFDCGVVLVSDGMGEDASLTLFEAEHGTYRQLARVTAGHSLGLLYSVVTYHLGFLPGMDEYKVMALAAMGDPDRFSAAFAELVRFPPDGLHRIPFLSREAGRRAQDLHLGALDRLTELFGPPHRPGAELTQHDYDLAAALQETLNQAVLAVAKYARGHSDAPRIAVAGGVGLNCVANACLGRSGIFDEVFVQPAAGDDGSALGAALAGLGTDTGWRGGPMSGPYWGPGFSDAELIDAARAHPRLGSVSVLAEPELPEAAAADIAAGRIIGWFQGRMEFGPRALGNRSILADPRHLEIRQRVNAVIKNREMFRPLAPAVLADAADQYFEIDPANVRRYRHMLFVAAIRPEHRAGLPAVSHSDGTARLQAVPADENPRFYAVLDAVGRRIGVPIVLNTSLNVQGQPIVRTPAQAVETAHAAGLDCVYLGPARLCFERAAGVSDVRDRQG